MTTEQSNTAKDLIFSAQPQGEYERLYINCTPARLEDELVKELLMRKKYVEQAKRLIRRINVLDPIPVFTISEKDIPPGLANQIERQGKSGMETLVTYAVRKIYQAIDSDYFYVSGIYGKVRWEFED